VLNIFSAFDETATPNDIKNQLQLFEKLKEWKFNLYDLPKEYYIEISEINGK
jgi:hypothetical protein